MLHGIGTDNKKQIVDGIVETAEYKSYECSDRRIIEHSVSKCLGMLNCYELRLDQIFAICHYFTVNIGFKYPRHICMDINPHDYDYHNTAYEKLINDFVNMSQDDKLDEALHYYYMPEVVLNLNNFSLKTLKLVHNTLIHNGVDVYELADFKARFTAKYTDALRFLDSGTNLLINKTHTKIYLQSLADDVKKEVKFCEGDYNSISSRMGVTLRRAISEIKRHSIDDYNRLISAYPNIPRR